jgi:hypothetical protein
MEAGLDKRKREPFGAVQTIPYQAQFSTDDFERIKKGHKSIDMNDKWDIYFENNTLFLHRSWTGMGVYQVDFSTDEGQIKVKCATCSTKVLVQEGSNYKAQLLNFLINNLLLSRGEPFPVPAHIKETASGVFQHSISGSGYPEAIMKNKKQWWKFWR